MFSWYIIIVVLWVFGVLIIGIEPLNTSQENTSNDVDPLKKMICLQISNKTFQVVTIFEFDNDIYFSLNYDHDNNNNTNHNNNRKRLYNTNLFKFCLEPDTISMVTTLNFSKGRFRSFDVLLELEHSGKFELEIHFFDLFRWPKNRQFRLVESYGVEKYVNGDYSLVPHLPDHPYNPDFCVAKIYDYLLTKFRAPVWHKTKMILKSVNYLHHGRCACFLFETSDSSDKLIIIYEFYDETITEIDGVYGQKDIRRNNNQINQIQLMFSINDVLILINDQQELYLATIHLSMRVLLLGHKIVWSQFFKCDSSSASSFMDMKPFLSPIIPSVIFGQKKLLFPENIVEPSFWAWLSRHTLITASLAIVILTLFVATIVVLVDQSSSPSQENSSAGFENRKPNRLMGIGQKTLQKRHNIEKQKQMVRENFSMFNQNLLLMKAVKTTTTVGSTTSSSSSSSSSYADRRRSRSSKLGFQPFDSTVSFRTSDDSLFTPESNTVIRSPPDPGRANVDPMGEQFIMGKFSKTYFNSKKINK